MPPVLVPAEISACGFLQEVVILCICLSVFLSNFGGSSLPCVLSFLMDLRRFADFKFLSFFLAVWVWVMTSKVLTFWTRNWSLCLILLFLDFVCMWAECFCFCFCFAQLLAILQPCIYDKLPSVDWFFKVDRRLYKILTDVYLAKFPYAEITVLPPAWTTLPASTDAHQHWLLPDFCIFAN